MTNILDYLTREVEFYLAWVQGATTKKEADEATLILMEWEGLYITELARPGRIIRESSFARGSKTLRNTAPAKELVEARRRIVTEGLRAVKATYKDKGWEF
jgi:hypothetical protein